MRLSLNAVAAALIRDEIESGSDSISFFSSEQNSVPNLTRIEPGSDSIRFVCSF